MRKIVVMCPSRSCHRPVAKDVQLRAESLLTIRCFHCGSIIQLIGAPDKVIAKALRVVENFDLTDDENGDTVFLSI